MDWFEVVTTDGEKKLINANAIMSVYYTKDTNLTVIDFIRSAYPSTYVRGNITTDIKRLLNSHDHYVSSITGE